MVTRLASQSRSVFKTAEVEARENRSQLVEAEHLLLALSALRDTDAERVLVAVGLTHDGITRALIREFESSLEVAGVSIRLQSLRPPSPDLPRRLRLGASFKAALERSVAAASGSRRIGPSHLLLGVLGARFGTVPRALHFAGIDPAELVELTERGLTA